MQKILIVDYGSQYTMLIARRLRELSVYCEIVHHDYDFDHEINEISGFILSGGPASVLDDNAPHLNEKILTSNVPVLGICYGMQIITKTLNAKVSPCQGSRGYGNAKITITDNEHLLDTFNNNEEEIDVWMSHSDSVDSLPKNFISLATGTSAKIMAMADVKKKIYALQFHPEVTHTKNGIKIIEKFIYEICQMKKNWTSEIIVDSLINDIQEKAKNEKILLGLSGGVDSAVVAKLIEKACPGNLNCVLVDNGLMRANEIAEIKEEFQFLNNRLIIVDAKEEFLTQLAGVEDPEEKRKIIGKVFIEVFEKEANKLGDVSYLAQGTIYPDVVESAGNNSTNTTNIKSHHNVGGLPEKLNLKLLEPLRMLFKDEVRKIGLALGLNKSIIGRHPFPGPGLAVRVIGTIDQKRLDIIRQADEIFIAELKKQNYYDQVSQAFVVLLPVASVGVQGDERTYENVIAVRAVTTEDFMTAKWAQLPHDLLATISSRIINEVVGVNRVVYDISSKPPATIEWE